MFRKRVLDVGKAGLKQIFAQQKRTNYNTNMSVVSGPPTVKVSKQVIILHFKSYQNSKMPTKH